jgi:hypothetical protein
MDRKQKIMRLIIENLTENPQTEYTYTGAVTTMDPNVISLEFTAKKANIRGEFNIWGMIDVPLRLKAQYDSRSQLNDHPVIQQQVQNDLDEVSARINRLL